MSVRRMPKHLALVAVAALIASVMVAMTYATKAGADVFTPITKGDLAVSLPNEVDEFTPSGTFVQHLVTSVDGLGYPTGSAFDGNGNLYVTDFSNNQILRRDALTGLVSVFASNTTLGNGHVFNSPESIVFSKGYSRMYVSDADRYGENGGINVIDTATGTSLGFYPLPSSQGYDGPGQSDWLAFDANSNLYMTNENPTQGVMKVDPTTGDIVQPSFVPSLPTYGYAISFDKNGNLWVGDTNSILEFDASGAPLRTISNPNFSLIFAAVFSAGGDQFYAGDLGTGTVYTYDLSGNLVTSFGAGSSVSGLSVAGAAIPPNTGASDVQVAGPSSNEPSLAVDPKNADHVVVGYNHQTDNGARCSWSETTDGGKTWKESLLPGTAHSNYGTDPTVRFASDGTLYYSCEVKGAWSAGLRAHARDVSVLLYQSNSGKASQFAADASVIESVHQACPYANISDCDNKIGLPLDHPSLALAHEPGAPAGTATRAVTCWTRLNGKAQPQTITLWRDPDSSLGDKQHVGDGWYCFMSGPPNFTSVSWLDSSGSYLAVKSSSDGGEFWTQVLTFPTPGLLSPFNVDRTILASPDALTTSDGAGGVHVIISDRSGGQGRVYVVDSKSGYALDATLANNGSASFLPGVGNCQNVVGAYERTSAGYGYTVWIRDNSGHYTPAFQTRKDMGAGYATDGPYQRIGDYTDAGCVGSTAWVTWTDSHDGQVTIRAVRLQVAG
jgi:hypothetical protein